MSTIATEDGRQIYYKEWDAGEPVYPFFLCRVLKNSLSMAKPRNLECADNGGAFGFLNILRHLRI
jgi:hypothetical protein